MKQSDPIWNDIIITGEDNEDPILIFITKEMFVNLLLDTLGETILVEVIEDEQTKIITIGVLGIDTQIKINYTTNKIPEQNNNFEKLKLNEVHQWTVGYYSSEKGIFHTPTRTLIY